MTTVRRKCRPPVVCRGYGSRNGTRLADVNWDQINPVALVGGASLRGASGDQVPSVWRPRGGRSHGEVVSTRSDPPSDDINRIWLEVNDSERAYAIHFPSGDH